MKIKPLLVGCAFLVCLGVAATARGEQLPGVWFLNAADTGAAADRLRLVVGGSAQNPPASPEQICLGWSWRAGAPDIDLYPNSAAGVFLGSEATWSLSADGETIAPESCRSAGAFAPFPELGLGPADELWLLAPEQPPARRSGWADLLHAVEAAYRQSTPSPLAESTIGTLGRCAVRSLPVALDTRLDRWSPVELPRVRPDLVEGDPGGDSGGASAGPDGLIRGRRFLWWVEPPAPGESCADVPPEGDKRNILPEAGDKRNILPEGDGRNILPEAGDKRNGHGTLRLFPVPVETTAGTDTGETEGAEGADGSEHFLTISGVEWQRLRYFALDADDWSPHLRRLRSSEDASDIAPGEARQIALETSPEQRRQLLVNPAFDLCEIEGLAELCRRNARARRQLYTAIPRRDAQPPWPAERLGRTQEACRSVLGEFRLPPSVGTAGDPDACTTAELWQRPIAGELVSGFSGEILIAGDRIRETWHDGVVEWRLEDGDHEIGVGVVLELRLLDGTGARIATRDLIDLSLWQELRRYLAPSPWWVLAAGIILAAFAILTAGLRQRRLSGRVERAERRLRALRATVRKISTASLQGEDERDSGSATGGLSEDRLRDLVRDLAAEAVDARLLHAAGKIEEQANAQEERLSGVARQLGAELRQESAAMGEKLRGALRHEAQSLSEGLRQDSTAGASPYHRLCRELAELPEPDRESLSATLEAAGRLGDWIGFLWPILQAAAGRDLESIPEDLPGPAADEWQRAVLVLRAFCRSDAVALRALGRRSSGAESAGGAANGTTPDPSEVLFLDNAGLLAGKRHPAERLKRYLEPFDQPGRLGEVTLALQYLVEAYPIEQLAEKSRRTKLRRGLSAAHRDAGLEEDFHRLVARIAAGVGLLYRPVPYYKSRTDQNEYSFVRQQVSPISLSERVGFKATTEKETIVRLERPFFDQLSTGIYYAGHAHVARG